MERWWGSIGGEVVVLVERWWGGVGGEVVG